MFSFDYCPQIQVSFFLHPPAFWLQSCYRVYINMQLFFTHILFRAMLNIKLLLQYWYSKQAINACRKFITIYFCHVFGFPPNVSETMSGAETTVSHLWYFQLGTHSRTLLVQGNTCVHRHCHCMRTEGQEKGSCTQSWACVEHLLLHTDPRNLRGQTRSWAEINVHIYLIKSNNSTLFSSMWPQIHVSSLLSSDWLQEIDKKVNQNIKQNEIGKIRWLKHLNITIEIFEKHCMETSLRTVQAGYHES